MEQRRLAHQTPKRRAAVLLKLESQTARLKGNIFALYLAARDPRTPWYAKALVVCVVGYALSPIDLIPDVIPILGYIDDLLLLPLGIYIAMKLIPQEILADCQAKAAAMSGGLPRNWRAALLIVIVWLLTLAFVGYLLSEFFGWIPARDMRE
jgi:uncharacterized membrane protein YkvA (DUF1232 family)